MSLLQAVISVTVLYSVFSSPLYTDDGNCTINNLGIIGGRKVKIEDVPFMVALHEKLKNGTYEAICGGTIVHESFVLTAAHCLYFLRKKTKLRVLVGTDRLDVGGMMVDVKKHFCHKGFAYTLMNDDICLLKLSKPVSFGCQVAKVTLPDKGYELEEGTMVNVTGWGDTEDESHAENMENNLYQTEIPIVADECCTNIYYDFKDELCAGSVGHDSCKGDSGGPLTYNDVQVGIVSYGMGCGINPGVNTKVVNYLDWIDATIQENL